MTDNPEPEMLTTDRGSRRTAAAKRADRHRALLAHPQLQHTGPRTRLPCRAARPRYRRCDVIAWLDALVAAESS